MKKPIVRKYSNKTIVVYHYGKRIAKIKPENPRRKRIERALVLSFLVLGLSVSAGLVIADNIALADTITVFEKVRAYTLVKDETLPSALQKAAYCETTKKHIDRTGKVIVSKTGDVGYLQISPIHFPEMKKLGLNPYELDDNQKFAMILFEREGLAPWNSSTNLRTLKCRWQK